MAQQKKNVYWQEAKGDEKKLVSYKSKLSR